MSTLHVAEQSPPECSDDAQLVAACRRGDAAAWEWLVRRYQRLVYTVPRRARLAEQDAADVFQNVFEKLHRNIDGLKRPDRLDAWLVTTAKRETLRLLRDRRRKGLIAGDDLHNVPEAIDPDPLPDEVLEVLQANQRLRQALQRLPDPCRSLLQLLYCEEKPASYAEIARRLAMAEGSIGPTRARCLAKLRQSFESAQ